MPNGETLGYAMGDEKPPNISNFTVLPHRISSNSLDADIPYNYTNSHPWGVFFTILGTVLLDFDADACQSPARAYLLDVTVPGNLDCFIFKAVIVHYSVSMVFFQRITLVA